jgi:hypothetical protein
LKRRVEPEGIINYEEFKLSRHFTAGSQQEIRTKNIRIRKRNYEVSQLACSSMIHLRRGLSIIKNSNYHGILPLVVSKKSGQNIRIRKRNYEVSQLACSSMIHPRRELSIIKNSNYQGILPLVVSKKSGQKISGSGSLIMR